MKKKKKKKAWHPGVSGKNTELKRKNMKKDGSYEKKNLTFLDLLPLSLF